MIASLPEGGQVSRSGLGPPAVLEGGRPALRLLLVRVVGYLTNQVVSGVPSFRVRHWWYRRVVGMEVGPGAGIYLGCYVWFYGLGQVRRSGLRVGANTRINRNCCLDGRGRLLIGDNVSVSPEVSIITAQHDYTSPDFRLQTGTVTIEDNVWIGTRATVLPDTVIGRGAVVAAGAVVKGQVAPLTVVAGIPARPVAGRPEGAAGYELEGPLPLFE